MDGEQKASDCVNYKGQLVLTVCGERQIRRIVRSLWNKTLAQIISQLNDSDHPTVIKRVVQLRFTRFRKSSFYKNAIAQCSPLGCMS
ncbi:hypothetical protein TNCV_3572161 [Trichonephila clavipes]|nr:hypothetical protein TNCV_3572161 [Trichonephila clavipes]